MAKCTFRISVHHLEEEGNNSFNRFLKQNIDIIKGWYNRYYLLSKQVSSNTNKHCDINNMGFDATKPFYKVSDNTQLKPIPTASETS